MFVAWKNSVLLSWTQSGSLCHSIQSLNSSHPDKQAVKGKNVEVNCLGLNKDGLAFNFDYMKEKNISFNNKTNQCSTFIVCKKNNSWLLLRIIFIILIPKALTTYSIYGYNLTSLNLYWKCPGILLFFEIMFIIFSTFFLFHSDRGIFFRNTLEGVFPFACLFA